MKVVNSLDHYDYEQCLGDQLNPPTGYYCVVKHARTCELERLFNEHPPSDDEDVDEKAYMNPHTLYSLQLGQAYWHPNTLEQKSLLNKIRTQLVDDNVTRPRVNPIHWDVDDTKYIGTLIGPYTPGERSRVHWIVDGLNLPGAEARHVYHNNNQLQCDYVLSGGVADPNIFFRMKVKERKDVGVNVLSFMDIESLMDIADEKLFVKAQYAIYNWIYETREMRGYKEWVS